MVGIDGNEHAGSAGRRIPGLLRRVWAEKRIAVVLVVAAATTCGLAAAWWTPRGPLTTTQSLTTMAVCLLAGTVAGLLLRSRWAMLAAPAVTVVVFETARLGTDGPTVDGIHTSTYGILAFLVGRGFHALIGLAPMVLGAAIGASTARRLSPPSSCPRRATAGTYIRRGVAALAAMALIALAALIARPAATAPIPAADGSTVPGSIAELTTVETGGKELGLMLRGVGTGNPVIFFLAGGPCGSELGAMRNHLSGLEETFVVATLDQRGTGTSYPELDPANTLTLDSYVADTIAVTNYLRERFGQDRIYLLAQSGGTLHGILAVQQAPGLYEAFIGTGQMVSPRETDRIFYQDTLAWAGRTGNRELADRLEQIGPPPYANMLDYETALSHEHQVYPYDRTGNSEGEGGFSENFIVPEYTFTEQVHLLGAFMDTFAVLYPQLQEIDFRDTATSLDVPVYFVQGAHEARGQAEPFREWFRMLEAPGKHLTELATSGHRPLFEQPDEFIEYMNHTVLARAGS